MTAIRAHSRMSVRAPGHRRPASVLLLTGTPGDTDLKAPPKAIEIIGSLLPPAARWRAFFRAQGRNPLYLQDGDKVEMHIGTDDGAIDLGTQTTTVRHAV